MDESMSPMSDASLSAGEILLRLTASATLAAGALLYGAGSATLSTLALGTAGRVLVAGASAPAWSDAGLSYASGVLAIAGSVPGTPSAGQVLIGGGAVRTGSIIFGGDTIVAQGGSTPGAGYQLNACTMGWDTASKKGWIQPGGTAAPSDLLLCTVGGSVVCGGPVSCASLSSSGDITLANTGGGASASLTAGTFGQMLKWQRYGYSTSYTDLQIGNASYGVSFGYDTSANSGAQFYGDNRDIFFRRGAHIGCANAGGTDFVWALRISGGAASNGAHILELTDDVASFLGNAPGTPGATEVRIGNGQINAGAGISCVTVAATQSLAVSASGTSNRQLSLTNTGGTCFVAMDASVSDFGGTGYGLVLYTPSGRVIEQIVAGTGVITRASATAFTVFSTLDAQAGLIQLNTKSFANITGGNVFNIGAISNSGVRTLNFYANNSSDIATLRATIDVNGLLTCNGGVTSAATIYGALLRSDTYTPASASAAGVAGFMTWDANYLYVCTADNTWKRVAIATW